MGQIGVAGHRAGLDMRRRTLDTSLVQYAKVELTPCRNRQPDDRNVRQDEHRLGPCAAGGRDSNGFESEHEEEVGEFGGGCVDVWEGGRCGEEGLGGLQAGGCKERKETCTGGSGECVVVGAVGLLGGGVGVGVNDTPVAWNAIIWKFGFFCFSCCSCVRRRDGASLIRCSC